MFSLLLAQTVCTNEMRLTAYRINGKSYLIPDGRLKLFSTIMQKIANGEAYVVDEAATSQTAAKNGGSIEIEPFVKWISGVWEAGVSGKLKWTWASAEEQQQNIGIGLAGGFIATPIGGIGIVFPVIYKAQDGSEQIVYVRLIESDAGTIVLPSYHADTFDNLQNKLAEGAVQQVVLD